MSAAAGAPGTGTSLLRKSVLVFGSGGALGSAVAHAFAAAHWRVIGCTSGWPGSPCQDAPESAAAEARPENTSPAAKYDEIPAAHHRDGTSAATSGGGRSIAATTAAGRGGTTGAAEKGGSAQDEQAAAAGAPPERPAIFEKWHRSAGGWRATAAPPHAVVDVAAHSFERAFSLQKQGEDLLEQLQPLLATGPPLHAAICCSGAFDMTPPGSPFFLDEAQRLIKANCWPALLCAHTAAVLQREQRVPLLVVLIGAAAVARTGSTPSMIAYGCAKSYVHHLVRSLAASSLVAAPKHTQTHGSASAAMPTDIAKTEKAAVGSSSDEGRSSHESRRMYKESHLNTETVEAALPPSLRVIGLLPAILDTPANRQNMKNVSESVRVNTWTDVRDVAQQLLRWAENPEAVANGQFYVVNTRKGKTEFTLL